jgi:hypothetical protein
MSGGGGRFGGGLSASRLMVVTAKQQHNAVALKTRRKIGAPFRIFHCILFRPIRETLFSISFRPRGTALSQVYAGIGFSPTTGV